MKTAIVFLLLALSLASCSLTRHPQMTHEFLDDLFKTDYDYACSRRFANIPGVGGSVCGTANKDCCKPIWRDGGWRNNTCESCYWWGGGDCCIDREQTEINDLEYSNIHSKFKTDWFGVYCDDECGQLARTAPHGQGLKVEVCDVGMPVGPRKKSCCNFGCSDSATSACNDPPAGSTIEAKHEIEDCTIILHNGADNVLPVRH